jgi:hypothetical protein
MILQMTELTDKWDMKRLKPLGGGLRGKKTFLFESAVTT